MFSYPLPYSPLFHLPTTLSSTVVVVSTSCCSFLMLLWYVVPREGFMNCFSAGPLHSVQSTQNRQLQPRCPAGHSCCQESAPARALHGLQLPSGQICSKWSPSQAVQTQSSSGCTGTACWSSPQATGALFWCGAPPSLLFLFMAVSLTAFSGITATVQWIFLVFFFP